MTSQKTASRWGVSFSAHQVGRRKHYRVFLVHSTQAGDALHAARLDGTSAHSFFSFSPSSSVVVFSEGSKKI